MFPRKSLLLKRLCVLVSVLACVWWFGLVGPPSPDSVYLSVLALNDSELLRAFDELNTELNMTYSAENKTLDEVRSYVAHMKRIRPVNPHRFAYLINPSRACVGADVFLLVYVHSAPGHYRRRTVIRQTWGNRLNVADGAVRVIFLLGRPDRSDMQDALGMEADLYGDIVQEDFVDSYRNLTYKAIMGLKWVSLHCTHARFVLKTDDDVFVNMFVVVRHLRQLESTDGRPVRDLLQCMVWRRMKVMRDPKSKWYISKEEYRPDFFPTYCSGLAFLLSTDVVVRMFDASLSLPFFWVDDFYVTGQLAQKVGVKHRSLSNAYNVRANYFREAFTDKEKQRTLMFGHVHDLNDFVEVWQQVVQYESHVDHPST